METKTKTYVNLRNGKAAFNEDLNFNVCTSHSTATLEVRAITPSSKICVLGTSSLDLSLYSAARHADVVLGLQKCVDKNASLLVAVDVGVKSVGKESQRRAHSIAAQGFCVHSPSLSRAAVNKLAKEGVGSVSSKGSFVSECKSGQEDRSCRDITLSNLNVVKRSLRKAEGSVKENFIKTLGECNDLQATNKIMVEKVTLHCIE